MNFNLIRFIGDSSSKEESEELNVGYYSYRLDDVLGRGCYGSVFKATNRTNGNNLFM